MNRKLTIDGYPLNPRQQEAMAVEEIEILPLESIPLPIVEVEKVDEIFNKVSAT